MPDGREDPNPKSQGGPETGVPCSESERAMPFSPMEVLDVLPEAVLIVDEDGRVLYANASAAVILEMPLSELLGASIGRPIADGQPQELSIVRAGRESRIVEMIAIELDKGPRAAYLLSLRDTTQQALLRDEYRRRMLSDELTGLLNRRGYLEAMHQIENLRWPAPEPRLALMLIDLDDFKSINDTFGHLEGDHVLREFAKLLRQSVRASDPVARIGGDEFIVVLPGATRRQADAVRRRLELALEDYNEASGKPYRLTMSVGFALYEGDRPLDLGELTREADRNMYRRKKRLAHRRSWALIRPFSPPTSLRSLALTSVEVVQPVDTSREPPEQGKPSPYPAS